MKHTEKEIMQALKDSLEEARQYIADLAVKAKSQNTMLRHEDFIRDKIDIALEMALSDREREVIARIAARWAEKDKSVTT